MSEKRLVWIDLEMTGLDPLKERIIEIATLITDGDLNVLCKGPHLVIHQDDALLTSMDAWNTEHHGKSGLTEAVRKSNVTEADAEAQTLAFLKEHVETNASPICGNSIATDRRFLRRYMPKLEAFFHYRHFDVSTFKIAYGMWYPDAPAFSKEDDAAHRADYDVLASIEEARYYRAFFAKDGKL